MSKLKLLISVTGIAFALSAQEPAKPANETKPSAELAAQQPVGRIRDERVSVENVGYWKNSAANGKGEYIEFTFDIHNKSGETIPLKMFVLAFNEKDLVDKEARKFVEYPRWRKFDEDKVKHQLVLFNSIPEIKHDEVAAYAKKKDETVAKNAGLKPRERETQTTSASGKKKTTLQDFVDYVSYLHDNPTAGIDISLQGFENAVFNVKCEGKTGKKECEEKRTSYTIEEKAMKVNVWGKLLSPYQGDRKFFNHLGIILYDAESKKIVFRQFYRFEGKFKIL